MWREIVRRHAQKCEFASAVEDAQLTAVERGLGIFLPSELAELLRESNGIEGEYKLALVWPAERILEDNLRFRSNPDFKELYMSFDSLVFFADAGNGDQFAYAIRGG